MHLVDYYAVFCMNVLMWNGFNFYCFCFYYFEKNLVRGRESAGDRLVRLRGFRAPPREHACAPGVASIFV